MPTEIQNMTRYLSFAKPINYETTQALLGGCNQCVNEGVTEVHLLISSPGGGPDSAFAIYNQLRALPIKFVTYNIGCVASAANIVFLAADTRFAAANATFLFHQTSWTFMNAELQNAKIVEVRNYIDSEDARLKKTVLQHTKLEDAELTNLMISGDTKGATFAKEKGIIQDVKEISIPAGSKIFQI